MRNKNEEQDLNSAAATALITVGSIVALCLLIGWLIYLVSRVQNEKLALLHRRQQTLLDKIDSQESLALFLESGSGQKFFESLERTDALAGILTALRRGIVFLLLGVGLIFVPSFYEPWDMAPAIGVLSVAGGMGLMLSAYLSGRLARRWGFMEPLEPSSRDLG